MSTCRLCMSEGRQKLVSVFTDTDDGKISDKIMFCASVTIVTDDSLPHLVCPTCVDKLHVAYAFRKQCELSEKIFKSKLHSLLKVKTESFEELDVSEILEDVKPHKTRARSRKKPTIDSSVALTIDDIDLSTSNKRRKRTCTKLPKKSATDEEIEIVDEKLQGSDFKSDDCDIKVEFFDDNFLDDDDYNPEHNIDSSKENKKRKKRIIRAKCEKTLPHIDGDADGEMKKRGRKPKIYYDHNGQMLDKKPIPFFFCEHCGKMFKNRNYFNLHVKLHSNEKNYECSICSKKFSTHQYLTRHLRSHSDRKLYKCQYCDREFNDWGSRQKHERLHRNEKPYTCDLCGKQFTYSYSLKSHKLVHSGIKMFGCELCKKSFTMKYHLMNHARRRHASLLSSGALLIGTSTLTPDGTKVLDTIAKSIGATKEEEINVTSLQIDLGNNPSQTDNR